MVLEEMRTEFRASTSGLGLALTDDQVNARLNNFFVYVIPSEVSGSFSEISWTGTLTTSNAGSMDVPDYVTALNSGAAWIYYSAAWQPISIARDPSLFFLKYPDAATVTGTPTVALHYSNSVSFNVTPDTALPFDIPCRGGSSVSIDTLPGINNYNQCQSIIHGAAWKFLLEQEDEVSAAREAGVYEIFIDLLRTKSMATYEPRRPHRSF